MMTGLPLDYKSANSDLTTPIHSASIYTPQLVSQLPSLILIIRA